MSREKIKMIARSTCKKKNRRKSESRNQFKVLREYRDTAKFELYRCMVIFTSIKMYQSQTIAEATNKSSNISSTASNTVFKKKQPKLCVRDSSLHIPYSRSVECVCDMNVHKFFSSFYDELVFDDHTICTVVHARYILCSMYRHQQQLQKKKPKLNER